MRKNLIIPSLSSRSCCDTSFNIPLRIQQIPLTSESKLSTMSSWFSFGQKLTPKEQMKLWERNLRKEIRSLDRQVKAIDREERKVSIEMRKLAKQGEIGPVKVLAKELVRSRKTKNRLTESMALLNSTQLQLKANYASMKIAGAIEQSTEVLASMQQLVKVPELSKNLQEMAREMEKAGLIQEMMDDALETLDPESLDEEADEEVDKIVLEITQGILNQAPAVPVQEQTGIATETQEPEAASSMKNLEARLKAL